MKSPFLYPTHAGLRHLLNCAALFKLPAESPSSLKKLPAFLPILLGLLLLLGGCKDLFGIKEDPVPPPSLPPATQVGATTFGCYLNSQLWLPHGSGFSSIVLSADYDYINRRLSFFAQNSQGRQAFFFKIYNIDDKLSSAQTFRLSEENSPTAFAEFVQYYGAFDSYNYKTSQNLGGTITLTRFDDGLGVVAGTFNFKAINELGDTIDVRYGRFDLKTHY